jgi:hypothetical protein
MGLCVKKNKSQYMGALGYPVARAGEAGLRGGLNALESRVSWLNQGKPLQPNPIDRLRIRMHKSQSDNPGLCGRRSQMMGSGNLPPAQRGLRPGGSNLSGFVRVEHWSLVGVFF